VQQVKVDGHPLIACGHVGALGHGCCGPRLPEQHPHGRNERDLIPLHARLGIAVNDGAVPHAENGRALCRGVAADKGGGAFRGAPFERRANVAPHLRLLPRQPDAEITR
jgi:hypothetical protein